MRFIFSSIFRKKSPFDGLKEHSEKVFYGIKKLEQALVSYLSGNFEEFKKIGEEVLKVENEADWIKGSIRNHLPKGIFMPVDKITFLNCLKEQDTILDIAEDIVVWLELRETRISEDLKNKISDYLKKVTEMVFSLEELLKDIKKLIVSLSPKERKKIKEKLKNFHVEEEIIDRMERELIRGLFSKETDSMKFFHLSHVIFLIAHIADKVENVSDYLRVMLAK